MPRNVPTVLTVLTYLAASTLAPFAIAGIPSAATSEACTEIAIAGIDTLVQLSFDALNPDFINAQAHYWSAANADLRPACAVFPNNTEEVSQIVTILNSKVGVNFAVKSGGHNPNVGFSSTDGGVLVSMSKMASTVLSADKKTAEVGPGARWGSVAKALDGSGVTVVTGRLADGESYDGGSFPTILHAQGKIGVGGLTLGGGLSFLSSQYGLACDNVANYEIVLANASIVNANATSNTDLWWALKGGGNQFGIVTKFTMKTHPMGDQVWGGIRSYTGTNAEALLRATQDFNENYQDHPKAAVIVTGEIAISGLAQLFVVFYFYDGPTPPPGVFDQFDAITHITDSTKTQSYFSVLSGNDATNLYGLRYLIRGTTIPNLPSTTGQTLYIEHYSQWKNYVLTEGLKHPDYIFSLAFQPMSHIIPAASEAAGGNALGMKSAEGDRMWMEYDVSWLTPLGDEGAHSMAMNITATIDEFAKAKYGGMPSSNYQSGDLTAAQYAPLLLNDAMFDQLPLQSYGDDGFSKLSAIQKKYDPTGFFPGRSGGFKFT